MNQLDFYHNLVYQTYLETKSARYPSSQLPLSSPPSPFLTLALTFACLDSENVTLYRVPLNTFSLVWSRTKLKPFSVSLMPLFKGKQSVPWGSTVPTQQWSALPEGFWIRASFILSIRRGNVETGRDWLGGWGLPYKVSRSYFLG